LHYDNKQQLTRNKKTRYQWLFRCPTSQSAETCEGRVQGLAFIELNSKHIKIEFWHLRCFNAIIKELGIILTILNCNKLKKH